MSLERIDPTGGNLPHLAMLSNDFEKQKRQGEFSLLVDAGRGVAELMAECRKCGAITRYGLELAWRLQVLVCPGCSTSMRLPESELMALCDGLIETRVRIDRLIPDSRT
jgi:RNase P subunit RPR2